MELETWRGGERGVRVGKKGARRLQGTLPSNSPAQLRKPVVLEVDFGRIDLLQKDLGAMTWPMSLPVGPGPDSCY
jgi:hypothetical protein